MQTASSPSWRAPRRLTALRWLLALWLILLVASPTPLALVRDFQMANAALAQNDYASAAEALANAAERLPFSADLARRAGFAAMSANHFDEALRWLRAAAAQAGWTADMYVAMGDAYYGLNQTPAALEQWELAHQALPDDVKILNRLATNYEALGQYDQAIAALADLAGLQPADADIHYRLALLTAANFPDQASARLTVALAVVPEPRAADLRALLRAVEAGVQAGDQARAFGLVGFELIKLKEWLLAEQALTQAVFLNPNFVDAYVYLGLAQDMQSKDGQAAYAAALKLAPTAPLAHFFLGQHWQRAGDAAQAIDHFTRAQTADPANPAIAAELGGAYASQGDLLNAEKWYTEAVQLAPQNADFWYLLARFYTDQNYHMAELGLPAARMAAGLAPESAPAVDVLGYALWLTGDEVNAQKNLERAITLDNRLPAAYYHLGLLYLQQGRTDAAQTMLEYVAFRLDPEGRYGNLAVKALGQFATP